MDIDKIISVRLSLGDADEKARLFSDEEIDNVLQNTQSVNEALYHLYLQKAGRVITNEHYIKAIKAGNEEIEYLDAKDLQQMCLLQAGHYKDLFELEMKLRDSSSFLY